MTRCLKSMDRFASYSAELMVEVGPRVTIAALLAQVRSLLLCVLLSGLLVAATAHAQWQIDAEVERQTESAAEPSSDESSEQIPEVVMDAEQAAALIEFEADKCSNGGPQTRAFIDFATQEPSEVGYVESIAQRFSQVIQQHALAPDLSRTSARSVQFMFELDRQNAVTSIAVFAPEEDTALKPFVVDLISKSAPFPAFDTVVDACFNTLVISAIFDF